MRPVAAHEVHVARAVGELEAELLDGEALRGLGIGRVEHYVRELDRTIAVRRQRCGRRLDDEAIGFTVRPLDLAVFADLGARAAEGDAADRRFALLEADDVGQTRRAAQFPVARGRQSPDLLEKVRGLVDIGYAQLDALQLHAGISAQERSEKASTLTLPSVR